MRRNHLHEIDRISILDMRRVRSRLSERASPRTGNRENVVELVISVKNISAEVSYAVVARAQRVLYEPDSRNLYVDMSTEPETMGEFVHTSEPVLTIIPPGASSDLKIVVPQMLYGPSERRLRPPPTFKRQSIALPSTPPQSETFNIEEAETITCRVAYRPLVDGEHASMSDEESLQCWEHISERRSFQSV